MATPKRIVLLGYDGVQTLDIAGPLDAFGAANGLRPGAYETVVASLDGAPFRSEAGLRMTPDCALAAAGAADTLMLPGGEGLRRPGMGARVGEAVHGAVPGLRRVVCVCTGIYGMAETGLLEGRRATTHWRFAADVGRRFPGIRLEPDAIFVKDGRFYSSAGITAAIDLALALIDEDYGPGLALAVARDLVVYVKRSGGQLQYSEPLQFQAKAADRFAELAAWMVAHLDADLSVEALAARAGFSARQFSRRFTQIFGASPAQQVEALRLDTARARLTETAAGIEQIAVSVGFSSDDAFRRAFDRRFGLAPTDYRRRVSPAAAQHGGDYDNAARAS